MRKWIVIGLLAVIGVGVLVYIVSQPKEGTVEWHKRAYLAAMDRLFERRFVDRAKRVFSDDHEKSGVRPKSPERQAAESQAAKHRSALVQSGFLVERKFVTMTSDAYRLTWWLRTDLRELLPKDRSQYTWIARTGTNEVTISGFKQDMPFWEDRVRKADELEYGK